jgi:hypothetical protein
MTNEIVSSVASTTWSVYFKTVLSELFYNKKKLETVFLRLGIAVFKNVVRPPWLKFLALYLGRYKNHLELL